MEQIGAGPVAIDTVVFIYYIDERPGYVEMLDELFAAIDRGHLAAVTSALTLTETLVVPYRAGDRELAAGYEALLTRSRGLDMVDIDRPLLRAVAHLRAVAPITTPDAIHVASALRRRCPVLLTNDRRIPEIGLLRVLQLDAFR